MFLVRIVIAIAAVIFTVVPATAQTTPPTFELAAGPLFGLPTGEDCSELEFAVDDCSAPSFGWEVEPAYFVTDQFAVVGRVSGLYSSVDTQARIPGFNPIDLEVSVNLHQFLGGVRFTGPRPDRRVTPYVQMLVGIGRVAGEVQALGLSESYSATGLSLAPEAGFYLNAAERFGIRIGGRYDAQRIEGITEHGFTLVTSLVFGS